MNIKTQNPSHMLEPMDPITRMEVGEENVFDTEFHMAVDHSYIIEEEDEVSMTVLEALKFVSDLAKKNSIAETDAYIVCPQLIPTFKAQQKAFNTVDTFSKSLKNLKDYNEKMGNQNG